MKEKILALLVAKFAGVPEATLERIATKKAGSVSDESQIQSVVDGIDYGQIVQSEVDSKITDANKKAVQNYETTHKLKDGKPVDKADPEPGKKPDPTDIAAIVAAELAKVVTPLQQQIAQFKGEKTTETRVQTLESKLKDLPDSFKTQKLKDFKRMNFETEEAFTEYLTEVETDITGLKQELADKGLSGHSRPIMGGQNKDGVSSAVASFIESKSDDKKPLEGKSI